MTRAFQWGHSMKIEVVADDAAVARRAAAVIAAEARAAVTSRGREYRWVLNGCDLGGVSGHRHRLEGLRGA